MQKIIKAINDRVKTLEKELQTLGQAMPIDDAGKMSFAERRKELNDMIKVMKNALKIISDDPVLMPVMQININDSDITTSNSSSNTSSKAKESKPKNKIKPCGNLFG